MLDFTEIFKTAVEIPVEDTAFKTEQSLPFAVYMDDSVSDGDDFNAQFIKHNLTVEFYAEHIDKDKEKLFESCFGSFGWKWERTRVYLKDERMYETIYTIEEFMERNESNEE